jgi:hypothetical protein
MKWSVISYRVEHEQELGLPNSLNDNGFEVGKQTNWTDPRTNEGFLSKIKKT